MANTNRAGRRGSGTGRHNVYGQLENHRRSLDRFPTRSREPTPISDLRRDTVDQVLLSQRTDSARQPPTSDGLTGWLSNGRRRARTLRPRGLARHESIAATVTGNTQLKLLQLLVDDPHLHRRKGDIPVSKDGRQLSKNHRFVPASHAEKSAMKSSR